MADQPVTIPDSGIPRVLESTHPLLQQFRKECPGTYKHSQEVASIVEAVAMEIGLDIDRMKVMAMYHDIGKMLNPVVFSENQGEDNVHDLLEPDMSVQLLTRHVSDTVMILVQSGEFQMDIIDSISRHHGTSVLKVFMRKAGSEDDGQFRYRTGKPKTVEEAVLMITDCAEASTRSMAQSGRLDSVSDHVERILQDLMNDGQLDDVIMKLGDLTRIKEVLKKELGGMFQKRVDYEEENNERRG